MINLKSLDCRRFFNSRFLFRDMKIRKNVVFSHPPSEVSTTVQQLRMYQLIIGVQQKPFL